VSLGYQASPLVVLSALLLIDIPWFLNEGKDLPLCSSYFPLRVSQLPGHNNNQLHASHQKAQAWGCPCQPKKYPRGTSVKAWGCPEAPLLYRQKSGHLSRHYIFIASYTMYFS
jgi:hypothetical protein